MAVEPTPEIVFEALVAMSGTAETDEPGGGDSE